MFMTRTQIAGLLYDQAEQESISEAFVPVVGKFHQRQIHIQILVYYNVKCFCGILIKHYN